MSIPKGKRKESKVEFDNTYFKIYNDCMNLIEISFGADKEQREKHRNYIGYMAGKCIDVVCDIGTHIRVANSIYPKFLSELEERRKHQDIALGLCFDLLTKYQLIMQRLKVRDNKFVREIDNISHEINCIKSWRSSDYNRYKTLIA